MLYLSREDRIIAGDRVAELPEALVIIAASFVVGIFAVTGSRLSVRQVSDLAATAFQTNSVTATHFRAKAPEFLPKLHLWSVLYIQDTPPYLPDGDMMVIVNDRTGRACVQRATVAPRPCE